MMDLISSDLCLVNLSIVGFALNTKGSGKNLLAPSKEMLKFIAPLLSIAGVMKVASLSSTRLDLDIQKDSKKEQ